MNRTDLIESARSTGLMFAIRESKLFDDQGRPIAKRALINERNGHCLSVVSPGYKVVTNEDMIRHTVDAVIASGVDTTDARWNVRITPTGARAMVGLTLPSVKTEMVGSTHAFQLNMLNSYDGSWKFSFKAGALRMACLNGQVLGKLAGAYSQYHNERLDVENAAAQIGRMTETFVNNSDLFNRMAAYKMGVEEATAIFARILGCEPAALFIDSEGNGTPRALEVRRLWQMYAKEMGNTAWALYNCVTDFISHHKTLGPIKVAQYEDALARELVDA